MEGFNDKSIFFNDDWINKLYDPEDIISIQKEYKGSYLKAIFQKKKYFGLTILTAPDLCPYNVQIVHSDKSQSDYISFKKDAELLQHFKSEITKYSIVKWKYHWTNYSVSPIVDHKVQCRWAQTSIISRDTSISELYQNLYFKTRNSLQNNDIKFSIRRIDFSMFYELAKQDEYYNKAKINFDRFQEFFSIDSHSNYFFPFGIFDEDNRLQSCVVLIRDGSTMYLWMNIAEIDQRSRNANRKLIWHSINFAFDQKCDFNFDGSNQFFLDKVFRTYNPKIIPYPTFVYTKNYFGRVIQSLKK